METLERVLFRCNFSAKLSSTNDKVDPSSDNAHTSTNLDVFCYCLFLIYEVNNAQFNKIIPINEFLTCLSCRYVKFCARAHVNKELSSLISAKMRDN